MGVVVANLHHRDLPCLPPLPGQPGGRKVRVQVAGQVGRRTSVIANKAKKGLAIGKAAFRAVEVSHMGEHQGLSFPNAARGSLLMCPQGKDDWPAQGFAPAD